MSEQSSDVNRQLRLARRPTGLVEPDDFERVDEPLPELAEGEALMRTIYLGMDATVRTWLNRGEGYLPAVEMGEVVRGSGIGRVVATRCDAYADRRRGLRRCPAGRTTPSSATTCSPPRSTTSPTCAR